MRVLDQQNDAIGAVGVEWHWFLISVRPVETPTLIRWTALPMIFIWRLVANSNPQMIRCNPTWILESIEGLAAFLLYGLRASKCHC